MFCIYFRIWLPTHDSLFAKEDIDNSDVLLPGVVEVLLYTPKSGIKISGKAHCVLGDKQVVLVPPPHWADQ